MGTQTQIVGGQSYEPYSQDWYKAREQDAIHRAGVGGTAEGTGEAAYLSQLSPSLAGLYAAMNGGQGGSSSSFTMPGSVGYPSGGSSGRTSTPNTVMYPSSTTTQPSFDMPQVSSADLMGQEDDAPPTATIAPVDFTAANSAAFATAKDQAARTASASMTGLQQALSERGMGGAGYEAGQIGQTLSREANTIGEAGRAQAQHEADLKARAAETNLAAEVTQRGQTMSAQQAKAGRNAAARTTAYTGGIAQRGQDIGAKEDAAHLTEQRNATDYSGRIAQRGQDIGQGESDAQREADAEARAYQGAVTQRGQDIQAGESAADLAARNATMKSSQTLQLLQAILGRGRGGVPGYVY